MSEHTLQDLLARMQDRPITLGWGAILCFGRSRLNAMLQEQFVNRLATVQQIRPITTTVCLDDDCSMLATLSNVRFGAPRLSFAPGSIGNPLVTLSLPLTSGTYSVTRQPVGLPPTLASSTDLEESQGFSLSMQLSLGQASGEVDQSGRISLDLAEGRNLRCNLVAQVPAQEKLGQALQAFVNLQPDNGRRFELGLFEFTSHHPLAPYSFHLLTQAAPDASDGDGAVLLFVRLRANLGNGTVPVDDGDFPYLIPSDRQGQNPRWSAALVLAEEMLEWLDEAQLDVLKNLLFPGQSVFVERPGDRHQPHDLLVLGNIEAGADVGGLEPQLGSIKAGTTRQFVARRGDGSVIKDVSWSTESLGSPRAVGSISSSGLYTAPDAQTMAADGTPALVLGRYLEGGELREVSASLLGRMEGLNIHPRIAVRQRGEPLDLVVSSQYGGNLRWELLEPAVGSLVETGPGQVRYMPPDQLEQQTVLQRIRCRDVSANDAIEAAVIISQGAATTEIEPYFLPVIDFAAPIAFQAAAPEGWARWTVQGGGTVDDNGLFTPPAAPGGSPVSLVCCEILFNGVGPVIAAGFSVVRLAAREVVHRWRTLDTFTVRPSGGLTQAYANGMQQIPLVIEVGTASVTIDNREEFIKLSVTELASLRLVDRDTGNELAFIDDNQEGMLPGAFTPWAMHARRNRFYLYSPNGAGQAREPALPEPRNDGVTYRQLYVHMGAQTTGRFFARFTGDDNQVYNSTDKMVEGSIVELTGVRVPVPDTVVGPGRHYDISRERVWNGEGESDGDDEFTYLLSSQDYWRILYQRGGFTPVPFATLRIEANVSTIRWESEQMDETFFSFTGYAFHPFLADFSGIDQRPTRLSFDPYLRSLVRAVAGPAPREVLEPGREPSPGELIVSLERSADMPYWYDGMAEHKPHRMFRALLDGPVTFVLLDMEGNRHRLRVAFQPSTLVDARNYLTLSIQ